MARHYLNIEKDGTPLTVQVLGARADHEYKPQGKSWTKFFWGVKFEGRREDDSGDEYSLSLWPEENKALEAFGPSTGDTLTLRKDGRNTVITMASGAAAPATPGGRPEVPIPVAVTPKLDVSYEDYMAAFWDHYKGVERDNPDGSDNALIATATWRAMQEAGVEIPFQSGPATVAEAVEDASDAARPSGYRAFVAGVLQKAGKETGLSDAQIPPKFSEVLTGFLGEPTSLAELTEEQATEFVKLTDRGESLQELKAYFRGWEDEPEFPPEPEGKLPWE